MTDLSKLLLAEEQAPTSPALRAALERQLNASGEASTMNFQSFIGTTR